MITKNQFSEKALETLADNYIQVNKGYGKLGRKAFLDGAYCILTILKQML